MEPWVPVLMETSGDTTNEGPTTRHVLLFQAVSAERPIFGSCYLSVRELGAVSNPASRDLGFRTDGLTLGRGAGRGVYRSCSMKSDTHQDRIPITHVRYTDPLEEAETTLGKLASS